MSVDQQDLTNTDPRMKAYDLVQGFLSVPWVQSVIAGNYHSETAPKVDLGRGNFSRYKMSWANVNIDGEMKPIVYPAVVGGEWLPPAAALDKALETRNFVIVNDPKDAQWLSEYYPALGAKPGQEVRTRGTAAGDFERYKAGQLTAGSQKPVRMRPNQVEYYNRLVR